MNITNACIEAAEATIPHTCIRPTSGRIPGWSERVQQLSEFFLFWYRVWIDCDRPKTGAVIDSMRRTRAAYHYTIRQVKKDEDSIVRERVASALLNEGGRNFWSEIKRIRSNKESISRSVDGLSEAGSIANLFAVKYRELYTSVPYVANSKCNIYSVTCKRSWRILLSQRIVSLSLILTTLKMLYLN